MGIPAARIEPGVRWQCSEGAFADDPDVDEEYAELCTRGEITLKHPLGSAPPPPPADGWSVDAIQRLADSVGNTATDAFLQTRALSHAIIRRAALDGYRAEARYVDAAPASWRLRLDLVGPLTSELTDPESGWRAETRELYRKLRETGEIFLASGETMREDALAPDSKGTVVWRELKRLVASDGCSLDFERLDDHGEFVYLRTPENGAKFTHRREDE